METAPNAREQRELNNLRYRRRREETGRFLVEGVRVVEDLVASPLTVHWALAASSLGDSPRGAALLSSLRAREVPVRTVEEREFAVLAATDQPQGILAVAAIPTAGLEEIAGPGPVLVLDAVQDPGNVGTLVRTAEALGAAGVVGLPGTVDPWNPKAVRSAVGASFRLPVVYRPWPEVAAWLRSRGYTILAAEAGGEPVPRGGSTALVVGNEGAGISEEVLRDADAVVGVPIRGRAESLNVAAAAAILLHELTR